MDLCKTLKFVCPFLKIWWTCSLLFSNHIWSQMQQSKNFNCKHRYHITFGNSISNFQRWKLSCLKPIPCCSQLATTARVFTKILQHGSYKSPPIFSLTLKHLPHLAEKSGILALWKICHTWQKSQTHLPSEKLATLGRKIRQTCLQK